ncbi:MAG: ribonuclease III [Rhizobiales bacterium]|nr:ribonuclease III [Hyphomicrobiales bacterium]
MPQTSSNGKAPLARLSDRLGYVFGDPELLHQALTHGSSGRKAKDYERLEFLGDRVLSLVIADALFHNHRKEKEGKLAARHSAIVRGDVCAQMGEAMGLHDYIKVGDTEKKSGVHKMKSVLGDVVEAVIGAIYIDGGLDAARKVILHFWQEALQHPDTVQKDAKTFVQEWALAQALALPKYELAGRQGPEHKPQFTVRLLIDKHTESQGVGPTKQAAEMAAATAFIAREQLR